MRYAEKPASFSKSHADASYEKGETQTFQLLDRDTREETSFALADLPQHVGVYCLFRVFRSMSAPQSTVGMSVFWAFSVPPNRFFENVEKTHGPFSAS